MTASINLGSAWDGVEIVHGVGAGGLWAAAQASIKSNKSQAAFSASA